MNSVRVSSRAALAGNPSDGFDGAVVSIPVPAFEATVQVERGARLPGLAAATVQCFERDVAPLDPELTITFESTIPRSVGLAGSSAIVIGGLRALSDHVGVPVAPERLSALAHRVERQDLGIAGGWQDQICQVAGTPVHMEFAGRPSARPIRPGRRIPFWVAWNAQASESSGDVHASLRREITPTTPEILELASRARAATDAFEAGDVHSLKAAMDATLDLRFELMPIQPAHRAMAETARSLGAACNFTGSGGAIIGVLPKSGDEFLRGLADAGLQTITWEIE